MRVKEVEKWFGRVLGRNKERGIGEMFKMNGWGQSPPEPCHDHQCSNLVTF